MSSPLLYINFYNINFYNLNSIFEYTGEKIKYNLFRYSKLFQYKLQISLYDYKKIYFSKDKIPEITKNNLLDYYYYLKRKFINKVPLQEIKSYYAEFFCKFLDENHLDFELNASHELAIDILLCNALKTINLVLNLSDYKRSYITENKKEKNKKPFLQLFQVMFDYDYRKVSQIKIISTNDSGSDESNISYSDLFIKLLIDNYAKYCRKIKTNILGIYELMEEHHKYIYDNFKNWDLIVPYNELLDLDFIKRNEKIEKNIKFDIDLNRAFNIKHLDFIKANKIKDYYLKLNYEDLWSFTDDFKNVKKLEINGKGGIWLEFNEENNQNYNSNNRKYIKYFNDFFNWSESHKHNDDYNLKFLNFFENSEFNDLTIIKDEDKFSLNKMGNSIEFILFIEENENSELFKKLTRYESVKLKKNYFSSYRTHDEYHLFKYDKNSKIKYFYLDITFFQNIPQYSLDFPINFEKLITLDLTYTLVLDANIHIDFPLTEKKCNYTFHNLKNLKIYFYYDCGRCMSNSPEDLMSILSHNFKYCPILESLDLTNEYLQKNFKDIKIILEGIKVLKNLRKFRLNDKSENNSIINEEDFYKAYPEYINYCPFLNDININICDLIKYDLLYEQKINYKINDIIINDYLYIKTLGEKDFYYTYLCKNKKDKKVVIRKFKKSRINYALDIFENEKYCLKKFRNNPNVINYIEFLEDEHFEYIVYEYIENSIKHFKAKFLKNKLNSLLYDFFYSNAKKDKKIILLPIFPTNFIITNNFDVILIGFGYLNLIFVDDDINEKNYGLYYPESYLSKDIGDNYSDILEIFSQKYIHCQLNFSSIFEKKNISPKYYQNLKKLKISQELKLEKELNIGKIIPTKDFIFTMQNNSIIIYFNNNFNKVTDIDFPEEENLINFNLIDDNILIVLNSFKMYVVSFDKKQLAITMVIEYKYLKEKFNINLNPNNDNQDSQSISFREITYMKDFDIIFTSGNFVCCWELNKKKKKLKFVKFYENLNSYIIFNIINNDFAQLIAVGNEKLIFYKIDEKYNLTFVFDYSLEINNYEDNESKIFKQDQNYCYVYVKDKINIFKIDFEQKKIESLFSWYIEISETNSILPFKNGLLFGCNVPFFQYLTKVKNEFELIEFISYLKNDKIFDMAIYSNFLYIIGNCNILIFEIKN